MSLRTVLTRRSSFTRRTDTPASNAITFYTIRTETWHVTHVAIAAFQTFYNKVKATVSISGICIIDVSLAHLASSSHELGSKFQRFGLL